MTQSGTTEYTLYVYTRVSCEIQSKYGYSLDAQKKLGIKKASEIGYSFRLYEERGRSAASENIDDRPKLSELLKLCDEGEVKYIFVSEWDRLTRNPTTQIFIKFCEISNLL